MDLDPDTALRFTRNIKAPRDLVWQCWTTPEHLKQFFAPKPHKVTECDIDLRVAARQFRSVCAGFKPSDRRLAATTA